MEKQILISGEVRSSKEMKKKNGDVFGHEYMLEIMNGKDSVTHIKVNDFDKNRKLKVTEFLPPVACRVQISDFDGKIEFNTIGSGNGNQYEEKRPPEVEQKKAAMKV
jgi:hypothetical protein